MIFLDFTGRRPLPVRDHVVSIKDRWFQKFGESMFDGTRSIQTLNFKVRGKNQFCRSYFAKHEVARLMTFYFTTRDRPLS